MLVAYPFNPTNLRALVREVSSSSAAPLRVLTNRGVRAVFSPATTALARSSCNVSVRLSRTARFYEWAHTARHDPECCAGSQTGSAFTSGLLTASLWRPLRGVRVSMI